MLSTHLIVLIFSEAIRLKGNYWLLFAFELAVVWRIFIPSIVMKYTSGVSRSNKTNKQKTTLKNSESLPSLFSFHFKYTLWIKKVLLVSVLPTSGIVDCIFPQLEKRWEKQRDCSENSLPLSFTVKLHKKAGYVFPFRWMEKQEAWGLWLTLMLLILPATSEISTWGKTVH